jgi:NADH dehydrogenase [ubiquinone] 1 alpha subcomplex assembly factor 7
MAQFKDADEQKRGNKFEEVMVDIDPAYDQTYIPSISVTYQKLTNRMPTTAKSPFRLAVSREPTPLSQVLPTTSPRFPKLQEGGRVEISQESYKISRKVGQLISKGGAGLYIDYGGPQMFGNSFRVCHLL